MKLRIGFRGRDRLVFGSGAAVGAGGCGGSAECLGFCAATSTVTGSETTVDGPPSEAASSRRWLPGGSGGGKMTNCPASSATTFAITRPPSRSSTTAFGAACPATTVSPVGSTRTTSNAGRPTAASAGVEDAAAGFFGSELPLAASGLGSFFALEVGIVSGDITAGDASVGSAGTGGFG